MLNPEEIDKCLPQTQCGECGYSGCMPYAKAIAAGIADINKCPPGGVNTLRKLAIICEVNPDPYIADIIAKTRLPTIAVIRESECIGCTKCIQSCPVDAIIGSSKHMHSVITHECTGCGLCLEPCPVDCIDLVKVEEPKYNHDIAREHFSAKNRRLLQSTISKKNLDQKNHSVMHDYLKKLMQENELN